MLVNFSFFFFFPTLLQMPVDRVIILSDIAKFPGNTLHFTVDGLLIENKKKILLNTEILGDV